MRKFNLILAIVIVIGIALLGSQIYAQQGGGRQQGGAQGGQQFQQRQQQFDPQQMMERRMQMIMERLKLSEEESAVIKPKIEALTKMRMDQAQDSRTLMESLQKAIDAKDNKQISTALKAVKDKRAEQKKAYDDAEKQLIELLSVAQEADLTIMGVVNSDSMMGFGGFRFGAPGQGPGQGMQRQRGQQGQGN